MANLDTRLSVIIPANNEAETISRCIKAVLLSEMPDRSGLDLVDDLIVVSNGCTDNTAQIAQSHSDAAKKAGWNLVVVDIAEGGKLNALNKARAHERGQVLVYLDADVTVSPRVLPGILQRLDSQSPGYASGRVEITLPRNWISKAYRRIYRQVPFMTNGVPGCGLFAVNASGRKRWGDFPDIISDDTFVRLSFRADERHLVDEPYDWPIVEGFQNLVKVRRRQDAGVTEIAERFPDLLENDDKPQFTRKHATWLAVSDPVGFATYAAVAVSVRLTSGQVAQNWDRGR